MDSLLNDVRVALRMLLARPAFTAVAIVTLAIGIGANTAVFSVVDGVLFTPLPYPEPEELVTLAPLRPEEGEAAFSLPDFRDWEESSATVEAMGLYSSLPSGPLYTGGEEPAEVETTYVTAGFFEALGRPPLLGRWLTREEEQGDNRAVMVSHGFWQRALGGDPQAAGCSITLDDEAYRVAGVMPPDFTYPSPETEMWVFLTVIPAQSIPLELRQVRFLESVGRLAPGATAVQARRELEGIALGLAEMHPETNGGLTGAQVEPLAATVTAGFGRPLLLLLGTAGLVLLLACANVAHLLLARGMERRREMAVRSALGAGRGRLVRQLLTECAVLSAAGGAVGVLVAYVSLPLLTSRMAAVLPRSGEIGLDGRVLAFALAATLATALLFGLLPALKVTRVGRTALGAGSRSPASGRRGAGLLVSAEAAAALLLVIGAALLGKSLWTLQQVDPGFDTERLASLTLTLNDARYPEREQYLGAYRALLERLDTIPGVEAVGSIRQLPMKALPESLSFRIPGRPEPEPGREPEGLLLQVNPDFFRAAGVPLRDGRGITAEDRADTPIAMVVNEALARRYWPGESPVGRQIEVGEYEVSIVGLAGDVKQAGLEEEAPPAFYVSQEQVPRRGMSFLLRTEGNPLNLLGAIRAAVWEVDPDQPIKELTTMAQVVSTATARPRLVTMLLSSSAGLALLLAAVGIYGVLAHAVRRRTHEIGVRMALGARRGEVLAMIVRQGMAPVAAGMALGLAAALALARLLEGLLYGVPAIDPTTYAAVVAAFTAIALLACYVPARAALKVDPVRTLRAE